jgi:hypothetical protein
MHDPCGRTRRNDAGALIISGSILGSRFRRGGANLSRRRGQSRRYFVQEDRLSDKGNTIGRVYGPVPLADVPAWAANPPIVAQAPEEAARLAGLHAGQGAWPVISDLGAVLAAGHALALAHADADRAGQYPAKPEATPDTAQEPRPGKGRDGAKVLGKGQPAICLECLVHAASSGAITLERL